MGFAQTDVTRPDGSVTQHHSLSTEGIGLFDSSFPCYAEHGYTCYVTPWWHLACRAPTGRAARQPACSMVLGMPDDQALPSPA